MSTVPTLRFRGCTVS